MIACVQHSSVTLFRQPFQFIPNSYQESVNNALNEDLLPELGCIPPWLSSESHCNKIYEFDSKFYQSFLPSGVVFENYTLPNRLYDQNVAQKRSKKPCLKMTILVERRLKQISDKIRYAVELWFHTDVVFKKKVVSYDMFNFVVDAGSSLGLWLGLSILNITDAVIAFVYNLNLKKLLYK